CTDIHEDALAAHSRSWPAERAAIARLDVTDPKSWQAALERVRTMWGELDVLYNIAGYLAPGWAAEVRLEDIGRHLDINVKGVMYGTRLAAEMMLAQRHGHIVNIGSMAAYVPVPGLSLYSASKFAVRAFS